MKTNHSTSTLTASNRSWYYLTSVVNLTSESRSVFGLMCSYSLPLYGTSKQWCSKFSFSTVPNCHHSSVMYVLHRQTTKLAKKCKPLSFSPPPPPQWRDQWGLTVFLLLFSEKTCRVALSSKSTVPWCSETWGRGSALTTRTTRWPLATHRSMVKRRTTLKNDWFPRFRTP